MNQQSSEQTQTSTPRHSTGKGRLIYLLAGGIVIAAAFVAGRLINPNNQTAPASNVVESVNPDGSVQRNERVELQPAEELPQSPPEVFGLYSRRADNSIFVKEGDGRISVEVNDDNVVVQNVGGSNKELEIVITGDTLVYKDVTRSSGEVPSADGVMQQKIAPGSADEIDVNSFISAWGQRRGDRIVADVLVYSKPMILGAP